MPQAHLSFRRWLRLVVLTAFFGVGFSELNFSESVLVRGAFGQSAETPSWKLQKATQAAMIARSPAQWAEVIGMCREAIGGLPEQDELFAKRLLASSLTSRVAPLVARMRQQAASKSFAKQQLPRLRVAALTELEEAITLDSSLIRAHWLIVQLHALPGGNRLRALQAADEALSLLGGDPADQSWRAKLLATRATLTEDLSRAQAELDEAVSLDPEDPSVLRTRAFWRIRQEKIAQAKEDLRKALQLNPRHTISQAVYARLVTQNRSVEAAQVALDVAIGQLPQVGLLYLRRAQALVTLGKFADAEMDMDKVVQLRPGDLSVLFSRAELRHRRGNLAGSMDDLQRVLQREPNNPRALGAKALLLAQEGQPDRALRLLERSLAGPASGNASLTLRLAALYVALGKPEAAISRYTQLLQEDPDNPLLRRSRGDVYISLGQHAEAAADYERTLQIRPNDPPSLNNLAWLRATSPSEAVRDGAQAVELAEKVAKLTRYRQPGVLGTLAAAYAENGQFEKATQWAEKALQAITEQTQREQLDSQLATYRRKQPWRESKPSLPADSQITPFNADQQEP